MAVPGTAMFFEVAPCDSSSRNGARTIPQSDEIDPGVVVNLEVHRWCCNPGKYSPRCTLIATARRRHRGRR